MDSNLLFYGVASIFYLLAGVKIVISLKKAQEEVSIGTIIGVALGILAHYWILQSNIFIAKATIQIGLGSIVSAMCFFSSLVLLFGAIYGRVSLLLGGILIMSSVGVWFPLISPSVAAPIIGASPAFKIHTGLSIVGYSFILMAVFNVLLAVFLGKDSQQAQQAKIETPRILMASFVFLSLTVLTGFISIDQYLVGIFEGDSEVTATVVTWLVSGIALLLDHLKNNRIGKRRKC